MKTKQANSEKWWQRGNILATILLMAISAAISFYLGQKSHKSVEDTNKISREQLEVTRMGVASSLINMLASDNPQQRLIAYTIAERIAPELIPIIAEASARYDDSKTVREAASQALKRVSIHGSPEVKQQAAAELNQLSVLDELREKRLLKNLKDAQGYLTGGSRDGSEKALLVYEKVMGQISSKSAALLDQNTLQKARQATKSGHFDQAVQHYQSLFADYLNANS